jgi:hypothetical protein
MAGSQEWFEGARLEESPELAESGQIENVLLDGYPDPTIPTTDREHSVRKVLYWKVGGRVAGHPSTL